MTYPVWHFTIEEFPEADPERPDVNLLVAWFVPDHFRGHPGHSAGETHAGGPLPTPSLASPEVTDLDHLVTTNQYTATEVKN